MATLLDEKKPATSKLASPSNIFPGNRLQGDSGSSGAPVGATPTPPPAAAPAVARLAGPSELYMQDRAKEMSDQWGSGNYAQATGTAARTAVQGLGMYGIELADKVATPAIGAAGNFASGLFGAEANAAQPAPSTTATPAATVKAAAVPAAVPSAATTPSMTPGLTNKLGTMPVTTAQAAPAASAAALPDGVYQHGRGQYSDQASGMGFPAGFTGQPNVQNQRAAASLAAMNSPMLAELQGGVPSFTAPSVVHSGNDWGARQRLKNMETSASSITNTPRWGGKGAMGSPDVQNFIDASRADLAAQGKQVDANLQTMGFNTALARENMGQQGANQRAALAESGASARANGQLGLGLGRLALDQNRVGSEERLREPQIRAAERMGQMQEAYINAETPEQKAAIAAEMRAYSGKVEEDRWKSVALQGGTDAQGNKTESLLGAVNERTGEMKRMGAAQPSAGVVITNDAGGRAAFAQLPSGATYTGPDGKQYKKN